MRFFNVNTLTPYAYIALNADETLKSTRDNNCDISQKHKVKKAKSVFPKQWFSLVRIDAFCVHGAYIGSVSKKKG